MIRLSPLVFLHEAGTPAPLGPENRIALAQLPSDAFGDGSHPTTRLCAGAVDWLCRRGKPSAVLDVGTGTGVLARIARARGVKRVVATDIDPSAVEAARANAALDGHPESILVSQEAPDSWGPCFELVIANILEGPLRELAPSLARAMAPDGQLLLSGFTPLQIPSLRVPFERSGLRFVSEATLEGWALMLFRSETESERRIEVRTPNSGDA